MGVEAVGELVSEKFVSRAQGDRDVLAVILFGSYARGDARKGSDVDICLVLEPRAYDGLFLSEKRLRYMMITGERVQVHVFQQLPIFMRVRVLREGKVLLSKNEGALYEIALMTVREFNSFERHYREYLEGILHA